MSHTSRWIRTPAHLRGGGKYTLLNENHSRICLSESNNISESTTNLNADSTDSHKYPTNPKVNQSIDSQDLHNSNPHDSHFDSHKSINSRESNLDTSLHAMHYAQNNNMPLDSHDSPTNLKANQINSKHESNGDSARIIVRNDSKLRFLNLKQGVRNVNE